MGNCNVTRGVRPPDVIRPGHSELACHTTRVSTGRIGHEPPFKEWILLGKCSHHLWIHPSIKEPFFDELCKRRVVFESTSHLIATYGSPVIPVREFVCCLNKAHCTTLWLKTYGQKLAIGTTPITDEPADISHPAATDNQWDIGINFKCPNIWLWGNTATNKSITVYPMIVPASLDLGTVTGKITLDGEDYGFKVYPRLVHTIKAFRSGLQGEIPTRLRGVRAEHHAAQEVVRFLASVRPIDMGGFRIEVTVGAATLAAARDKIQATALLTPAFWLHPPEHLASYKLKATVFTKEGVLANADWMHQKAILAHSFIGDNNAKPSGLQVQAMTDVLASFGWNAGKRRPTKSMSPTAWWIQGEPEGDDESRLLAAIHIKYNSPPTKYRLLQSVRQHHGGHLPCKLYPADTRHRYHVVSKVPIRLRCPVCRHNLNSGEIMKWMASLMVWGRIPRAAANLDTEHDMDLESSHEDDRRQRERTELGQDDGSLCVDRRQCESRALWGIPV